MAWNILDAELLPGQPITSSLMIRLRNGGIETGVIGMWRQNAAPLGWNKLTDSVYNDKAPRLVTGAPSTGGVLLFSTFRDRTVTDNRTLTQAMLPALTWPRTLVLTGNPDLTGSPTNLVRNMTVQRNDNRLAGGGEYVHNVLFSTTNLNVNRGDMSIGGNTTSGGGNVGHNHPMDMRLAHVDFCVFQKV